MKREKQPVTPNKDRVIKIMSEDEDSGNEKSIYKMIKGEFFRTNFDPNLKELLSDVSLVQTKLTEVI